MSDKNGIENKENNLCQACKRMPAEVIERADDPDDPYRLCRACHEKLLKNSLRPLEWYNLASIHGQWESLLDSEHYDQDGRALQPEEEVKNADKMPCPSFEEAASSPESFIGYIYSRNHSYENGITQGWHIDDKYIHVLKGFSRDELVSRFSSILDQTSNRGMIDMVFELCARSLGPEGADFVRERWDEFAPRRFGYGMALCAHRCLPEEEGFGRIVKTLSMLDERKLSRYRSVILWFGKRRTLDWIEENIKSPVDFVWGMLAADAGLDWRRARRWLERGRPLSLVALDALHIRLQRRAMGKPAGFRIPVDEVVRTLKDYQNRDDVPRVRETVSRIIALL